MQIYMASGTTTHETGAETIRWDLAQLYENTSDLLKDLDEADREAQSFEETYRTTIERADASVWANALTAFESIHDRLGRAYTYAYLNWSTQTNESTAGALLQQVRERYTQTGQRLIFFELAWAHLKEEDAAVLMRDERLEKWRHYLELQRLQARYLLTEPEEKILSEKDITGRAAWNRFFDESLGATRFTLDGEEITEQEILSKLHEPDRGLRERAAHAFTEGLQANLRTLTYVFNTILADKATNDRLRGYPHWLTGRNLANEVSDDNVEALVSAVTGRYDIAERFYRLKKRLLGVSELMDYDRYAPLVDSDRRYTWDESRSMVLDAYASFHPEMAGIAERFFEERWIDAAVVEGKRGGAFSHGAVPSAHPYVMVNFTGKVRDVQTLAHELGHGVHQYLSRKQGVLQSDTPLTSAETASVFGEMLVFQRLYARETEDKNRLAMLVGKVDDTMATVFRQVSMNRFEDRIHRDRREHGELTSGRFSAHWRETQEAMFRGSVTLGSHYDIWWSYIPHFLHTPGYVYAYAFGELLVLALYARYREEGKAFTERYLDLLSAGGSEWPHRLTAPFGVDLTDPAFWSEGLDAIDDMVSRAESLAAAVQE